MNIRYYFAVCIIILSFLSVVKASGHVVSQREESVIVIPTVFATNIFCDDQMNSLLNKVVTPVHSGNYGAFWKSIRSIFQKVARVYADLGSYLYNSIFSIFNW
ncbi:hypothetical protein V4B17_04795 [Bartonella sp. B23]